MPQELKVGATENAPEEADDEEPTNQSPTRFGKMTIII